MQSSDILINRVWQPFHMRSWTGAAMDFLRTKKDFVRVERKMTAGRWSPTCFLFNGLVNRPLENISDSEMERICSLIKEWKQIASVHEMEEAFKDSLEYPPISLDDDWDGKSGLRTVWARYVYDNEPRLRF